MTAVDVIVATRGRGPLIDATLTSIRQSTHRDFELWIIDQSVDDSTEQAVAPHVAADSRVHYRRSASQGVDIARNEGAAAGSAAYLFFTDDDCRVETDWLATMLSELEQEGVWAVFGRVLPDTSMSVDAPVRQGRADRPVTRALPMAVKDEPRRRVYQGSCLDLSFGHGASMAIRRDRFEEIDGFDELLGAGAPLHSWPERDLGYRILRRGGRIIYTPAARVYHRHWRGWSEVRRTYRNYAIGAGAATGKYLRCGRPEGLYLLLQWLADQGLRQVLSGAIKWRSSQKMQVGLLQMVYPWVGLCMGWRHPVDRKRLLYRRS